MKSREYTCHNSLASAARKEGTVTTIVIKQPEPLWARIAKAVGVVAVATGILWSLREQAVFVPALVMLGSAVAFWAQTGGRGLPMPPVPSRFRESVEILREGVGEAAWSWVAAGSRVWVLIQALAFGAFAALTRWLIVQALSQRMAADWADIIGSVLAVAICSFGLGLLIRKLAHHFGVRPWVEDFKASLKRAFGAPSLSFIGPVGWLAFWSLLRAVLVQLGKWGGTELVERLFTGVGPVIVLAGVAILVVLVPEWVTNWFKRLHAANTKETHDVRTD